MQFHLVVRFDFHGTIIECETQTGPRFGMSNAEKARTYLQDHADKPVTVIVDPARPRRVYTEQGLRRSFGEVILGVIIGLIFIASAFFVPALIG